MLPFSPLLVTNAMIEGLTSISTMLIYDNIEITEIIKKIILGDFDLYTRLLHESFATNTFDKQNLVSTFEDKKKNLNKLLKKADTGSLDYKRFSFIIQLLWDYMNPALNPFFYEDGTLEKGISAFLMSAGVTELKQDRTDWNYTIGENIATANGYVIFENEILQLLYFPSTGVKAKKNPVFIVPPWINKYYIFDLSTHNSYIKWLTENNVPVFCISWVNPDSSFSQQSFSDYITKGVHAAVQKALDFSNTKKINYVGYCVGGIALHTYAGWLGAQHIDSIASLTFLATPFDFEKLDNLRLFISEEQINQIENIVQKEGIFKGDRMMQTFALMRTNDLISQVIIEHIYLGKKQKPLDFLYWNADTMHLPGKMHLDFLRNVFLENPFVKKVETLCGLPLDYNSIIYPVYVLGTKKDHIVPWESCYTAYLLYKNVTFCLGGAGHVAGIINPPHQQKYGYHTFDERGENADDWFRKSTFHGGSWWSHWHNWVQPYLGKLQHSLTVNESETIEKSPGRYALQKAPPALTDKFHSNQLGSY